MIYAIKKPIYAIKIKRKELICRHKSL